MSVEESVIALCDGKISFTSVPLEGKLFDSRKNIQIRFILRFIPFLTKTTLAKRRILLFFSPALYNLLSIEIGLVRFVTEKHIEPILIIKYLS